MSKSLSLLIDFATDERQTEDDWTKILDVCENGSSNPKECFKIIMKRMTNKNPHIVLRCIILLDACIQNIGESFSKEISSRYFLTEIKSRSKNMHHKTLEKLCFMTKKWSRELTGPQYDCIKELNKWLQDTYPDIYAAGDDELNSKNTHKTNRKQIVAQEEEDLAKAIALSLKESGQKQLSPKQTKPTGNLYPTTGLINNPFNTNTSTAKLNDIPPVEKIAKVRALYDFEAVEDNELSFKAGELIVDCDISDDHWWYGHNHRGEGMFPAQFVTTDVESKKGNIDSFNRGKVDNSVVTNALPIRSSTPVIDESKIDECLKLIDDTDPTGEVRPDPPELASLENDCRQMGPLIDQELEKVDRHYNMLAEFNRKVMMAFQTYNELMTQSGGYARPAPTSFQYQTMTQGQLPSGSGQNMYNTSGHYQPPNNNMHNPTYMSAQMSLPSSTMPSGLISSTNNVTTTSAAATSNPNVGAYDAAFQHQQMMQHQQQRNQQFQQPVSGNFYSQHMQQQGGQENNYPNYPQSIPHESSVTSSSAFSTNQQYHRKDKAPTSYNQPSNNSALMEPHNTNVAISDSSSMQYFQNGYQPLYSDSLSNQNNEIASSYNIGIQSNIPQPYTPYTG